MTKKTASDPNALAALMASLNEGVKHITGEYIPQPEVHQAFVMQGEGIFEVHETPLATFVFKLSDCKIPGLPTQLKEGMTLKIPKIPFEKFMDMWNFFKVVHQKYESEVYTRIYFDVISNEFYFYTPEQKVVEAEVKWEVDGPNDGKRNPDDILVMQAHSHHTMNGHFSGIDDRDHQSLEGLFLVIGDIYHPFPSFQIRYAQGNRKVNVHLDEVFTFLAGYQFDESQFAGWEKVVIPNRFTPFNNYNKNYIQRKAKQGNLFNESAKNAKAAFDKCIIDDELDYRSSYNEDEDDDIEEDDMYDETEFDDEEDEDELSSFPSSFENIGGEVICTKQTGFIPNESRA